MTVVETRATVLATLAIMAISFAAAMAFGAQSAGAEELGLPAQDVATGAQVYAETCASCHQAGGRGIPGQFPPLLGNPNAADIDYVATVVRDGLDGPIEVLGVTYDEAMRGFAELSDDEVGAVAAYVVTLAETDPSAPGPGATDDDEVQPGDSDEGRDLFIGSTRFSNGGAACVGCHTAGNVGNLGGWSLGPDLTDVVATFGSEAALQSWMANPPSPTMEPVFTDHPLTTDEVADVAVFLANAPRQSEPTDPGDGLVLAGIAGLIVLIGGMAIAWRGMRQTYAQRLRSRR